MDEEKEFISFLLTKTRIKHGAWEPLERRNKHIPSDRRIGDINFICLN